MPATGALIGTPASISDRLDAHTEAIDVEPFEASTSDDEAQRVGELLLARHDRQHGPGGERTVADLAALRRTDAAGLAVGPRRHVVVVQVALLSSPG